MSLSTSQVYVNSIGARVLFRCGLAMGGLNLSDFNGSAEISAVETLTKLGLLKSMSKGKAVSVTSLGIRWIKEAGLECSPFAEAAGEA